MAVYDWLFATQLLERCARDPDLALLSRRVFHDDALICIETLFRPVITRRFFRRYPHIGNARDYFYYSAAIV